MTRRFAAAAIAIGGVVYAAWFLQWIVPTDLSAASSYISELSADDQPNHWLFRAADLISGLLLVLGSLAALRSTPRTRWSVAGWSSLVLFGLSTISNSLAPLPCAATANARCDQLSDLGRLGFADWLHTVTSAGQDLFFVLAMGCLLVAAHRAHGSTALRRIAIGVAIGVIIAGVWTYTATAEFELWVINDQLGVAQRTQVTLMGLWLILLAIALSPRFDGFAT